MGDVQCADLAVMESKTLQGSFSYILLRTEGSGWLLTLVMQFMVKRTIAVIRVIEMVVCEYRMVNKHC